jgi:hypothetical protein
MTDRPATRFSIPAFRPVAALAFRAGLPGLGAPPERRADPADFTFLTPPEVWPAEYRVAVRLSPSWVWHGFPAPPEGRGAGAAHTSAPTDLPGEDRFVRLREVWRIVRQAAAPQGEHVAGPTPATISPAARWRAAGLAPAEATSVLWRAAGLAPAEATSALRLVFATLRERDAGAAQTSSGFRPVTIEYRMAGSRSSPAGAGQVPLAALAPWHPRASAAWLPRGGRTLAAAIRPVVPIVSRVFAQAKVCSAAPAHESRGEISASAEFVTLTAPARPRPAGAPPLASILRTGLPAGERGERSLPAIVMVSPGLLAGLVLAEKVGGQHRRSDATALALTPAPTTVRAQPVTAAAAPRTPEGPARPPEAPQPPPAPLPPDLVQRVSEQVVRALDARALALRERFGRF